MHAYLPTIFTCKQHNFRCSLKSHAIVFHSFLRSWKIQPSHQNRCRHCIFLQTMDILKHFFQLQFMFVCFFSLSFPFFLFGQGYASALFRFEHHSVSVRKSSRFGLEYLNFDRHKRCWRCPGSPTKNIQRSNVQMVKRQRPMSEIPSGFALTNDT